MIELSPELAQTFSVVDRIKPRPIGCSERNALPQRIRNHQNI